MNIRPLIAFGFCASTVFVGCRTSSSSSNAGVKESAGGQCAGRGQQDCQPPCGWVAGWPGRCVGSGDSNNGGDASLSMQIPQTCEYPNVGTSHGGIEQDGSASMSFVFNGGYAVQLAPRGMQGSEQVFAGNTTYGTAFSVRVNSVARTSQYVVNGVATYGKCTIWVPQ